MNQHIEMFLDNESSALKTHKLPQFSPLDFPGWHGLAVENESIHMFIFSIDENASEFPLHASDQEWLAYVVMGEGRLIAGTKDNQTQTSSIKFCAGDAITFRADTPHAWKMSPGAGKILFCRQPST